MATQTSVWQKIGEVNGHERLEAKINGTTIKVSPNTMGIALDLLEEGKQREAVYIGNNILGEPIKVHNIEVYRPAQGWVSPQGAKSRIKAYADAIGQLPETPEYAPIRKLV